MDPSSVPMPPDSPRRVSKSRFKAQALELFRQVEASGEPLVVTDHGRPTLEVRPYRPARSDAEPLEVLRGSVLRFDDPFAPVGENDWEALA
jgi:antitoxin (DNA-binding transcriptional repressor) of toxin-antitoxin stability system